MEQFSADSKQMWVVDREFIWNGLSMCIIKAVSIIHVLHDVCKVVTWTKCT